MKLITKTQKYYLPLFVGMLLLWGAGFLLVISWEMSDTSDDALESELESTIQVLQNAPNPPSALPETPTFQIAPIPKVRNDQEVFKDTLLTDPEDGDREEFRQISTQVAIGGQPYRVVLRKSQVEYDDLFTSILLALLVFAVLLIAAVTLMNRRFLQHIWDPFYQTLNQLSSYSIRDRKPIQFKSTNIDEFQELNTGVEQLLDRIERDYMQLKQFTENASHEIQTPLSVIQNQIELLIQDEDLKESQRKRLGAINKMSGRLSRLNSALLLLTKIENQQYSHREQVNITALLEELITQYRELAKAKDIYINTELEHDVSIDINPNLAEMLFRNLLSNAIKHNQSGGIVKISLTSDTFSIINTGPEPEVDPSELFNRFQKSSGTSDSLGLGLSIVQTIAEVSDVSVNYQYENSKHNITVLFT